MIPIEDIKSDSRVKNDPTIKEEIGFLFQEESYMGYYILIAFSIILFQFFPRYNSLIKGAVIVIIFLVIKFLFPSIL